METWNIVIFDPSSEELDYENMKRLVKGGLRIQGGEGETLDLSSIWINPTHHGPLVKLGQRHVRLTHGNSLGWTLE